MFIVGDDLENGVNRVMTDFYPASGSWSSRSPLFGTPFMG
jgi:hypothetical protein